MRRLHTGEAMSIEELEREAMKLEPEERIGWVRNSWGA